MSLYFINQANDNIPYTIQKWLGSKHWHSLLQTVQQCTGREIRNCRKCSFWLSHLKSHVLDSLLWTEKKTKHWSHCFMLKHTFNAEKHCTNANQWSLILKIGLDWGASQSVGGGREEEVVVGDQGNGLNRVGNKTYFT